MNLDPENQTYLNNCEDLDSTEELEQIEDLIELLIEDEASDTARAKAVARQTEADDLALAEIAELAQESPSDSKPDFNFIERSVVEPSTATDLESSPVSQAKISTLEEVKAIEIEGASTEELADTVNSLIPLIIELLQFKLDNSQESVIRTVRPMLDRLIEQRTQEDSPKMAAAIARILPAAIEDEIKQNPQAIAKALAPEVALSIREQIVLDERAIPQALGSEMGKAIKAQIESEKDAMVDALYPVIGSTISKYMVEVVRDINSKIESTLSPEGIKRKFRAKMQGVSEAELIFKESIGYRVRAIFLIDKDSGLVIQEIQIPGEQHLDSDMLAGMLTAIRSFANDCIAAGSELDSIDYGDWQIPLEVAGYCYLAVIVAGEPPKEFITKIRRILGEIVIEHDEAIQNFDGNLANVPSGIEEKLEQLTETNKDSKVKIHKSSSPILLWLLIFLLGIIFVPWGIAGYRERVAEGIEQSAAIELDAAPELSVYRLDPNVEDGKLIVSGRVPSEYLRARAEQVVEEVAAQNKLEVDNQIFAVNVPPNPDLVRGEIARLTEVFARQPNTNIETTYQPPNLTVKGIVLDESVRQNMEEAFARIPGVERVIFYLDEQLPVVKQRIYFDSGSTTLDFADNFSKINAVKQLLQQNPRLNLKFAVYSNNIGSPEINRQLGMKRCQSVKTALVARGVEPDRLIANCNLLLSTKKNDNSQRLLRAEPSALSLPKEDDGALAPPMTEPALSVGQAAWLKRYVSFEPFVPSNSQ